MILLAESGSTKTDWRVVGKPELSFETIGLNPYFIDSESIASVLTPLLKFPEKVKSVIFYGTGITDTLKGDIVKQGIIKALGYEVEIITFSDIVAAARAAFGDQSGMVGILGTGSNSCFWNGAEVVFQIPPLGFWLGDEGSGGYLGKMLMLSYLHRDLPLDLRTSFEQEYGELSRSEILTNAYQTPRPNQYFASFTKFVGSHKSHNFIKNLIEESFFLYIKKYLLKYPMLLEHQFVFVGSVAHYFEDELRHCCEKFGLTIHKIISKPIDHLEAYHLVHN
jgi:N-acetylglucosamine kinase-like BadF-type ATPase